MNNVNNLFSVIYDKYNKRFVEECDTGNIEYKLRIDTKTIDTTRKLKTQMLWRLTEGYEKNGMEHAYYVLGVYDDGELGKLNESELDRNIVIFKNVSSELKLEITDSTKIDVNNSFVYIALVVKIVENRNIDERNIFIIGDPQSGKTTLLSNICYDRSIKNNILKHSHEKLTGITSDMKKEIIGIKNNNVINYVDYLGWDEIFNNSDKIINLYDIPVVNIKNTINYCLSVDVDFMVIISKNTILSSNIIQYIDFCKYYDIDYVLLYSKDIEIYDRKAFHNIFHNVIKKERKGIDLIENNSMFRTLEFYDIPDRNYIVSGIQINKRFNVGDISFIVNNTDYAMIEIKSIHKKNINHRSIEKNESGCIYFHIIDNKKIKINKNTYITDKLNNTYNEIHIIDKFPQDINTCVLYNGNINMKISCTIDNTKLIFDRPIIITDTNIVLECDDKIYYTKKIENPSQ